MIIQIVEAQAQSLHTIIKNLTKKEVKMSTFEIIILLYIVIQLIKSIILGPTFSFIKWIMYNEDYMKWYQYRQKYVPIKKREKTFNKK